MTDKELLAIGEKALSPSWLPAKLTVIELIAEIRRLHAEEKRLVIQDTETGQIQSFPPVGLPRDQLRAIMAALVFGLDPKQAVNMADSILRELEQ